MNLEQNPQAAMGAWRERRPRRHLGTGIVLILVGLILAFDPWGHSPFHDIGRHWPLILVALGIGKLVDRGLLSTGAHWLLLVGLYFELHADARFAYLDRFWPLGLVWIGLIMTLRALRPRPRLNP